MLERAFAGTKFLNLLLKIFDFSAILAESSEPSSDNREVSLVLSYSLVVLVDPARKPKPFAPRAWKSRRVTAQLCGEVSREKRVFFSRQ